MDTRANRLPALETSTVWEVDLPALQAAKKRRLTRLLGAVPRHTRFVPIDLEQGSLVSALDAAAFSTAVRSLFVMEGVTQYIGLSAVEDVLSAVAACARGSEIVFTYVPRAIIDGSDAPDGARETRRRMERAGHPWRTGFDPGRLAEWLGELGLTLVAHADAMFYREAYLRPLGRELRIFELERAAVAAVPASTAERRRF